MVGLGLGLGLPFVRTGGGGGAPAWMTGAPTLLGDITVTTTGDANPSPVTMFTNGWVLRVPTNLGAVSTFDGSKMTLAVTDYGWGADGSAVSWSRTVTGTARIFKPYPDGGLPSYTDDDLVDGVIEVALDQRLYNSASTDSTGRVYRSEISAIHFAEGFLNGSAAGSYTGAVTRLDSRDYPLPIWKHGEQLDKRMGPDGYIDYEWGAVHALAQKGQQLACLEAWARMGGIDGPVARASSMTESRWTADGLVPRGAPAPMHAPVYSTRVYGTGLADGSGTIRSRAKPWIGPAINSYDAGIGDTGISHNLMADMPFWKDEADADPPIYLWANQTDASGLAGTDLSGVFTSDVADPGAAASYKTKAQALTAARSWRNANRGQNNCDGVVIKLRDVAGSTEGDHTTAYSLFEGFGSTTATVNQPVTIMAASGVTSDAVRMMGVKYDGSAIVTNNKRLPPKLRLVNIKLDSVGVASGSGSVISETNPAGVNTQPTQAQSCYTILENCDVKGNGVDSCVGNGATTYSFRTRFNDSPMAFGFASWRGQAVAIGCSYFGTSRPDQTFSLACYGADLSPATYSTATSGPGPRQNIMVNSRYDCEDAVTIGMTTGRTTSTFIGAGIVGCLFRGYTNLSSRFVYAGGDGSITPSQNLVVQHTATPLAHADPAYANNRWNMLYNDALFGPVVKEASMKFNAWVRTATKASDFNAEAVAGGAAWDVGTAYVQGALTWDPLTGSNSRTTSNLYQALRDVPAGTPLSDSTYWFSAGGNWGTTKVGGQPRRTGNLAFRYGVDCYGNVNGRATQTGQADDLPGYASWISDIPWPGSGDLWGLGDYVNYFVDDAGDGLPGTGDYRPNPLGDLIGMVPAGAAVMPFDYLGTARKNDGTGAAGALEAA